MQFRCHCSSIITSITLKFVLLCGRKGERKSIFRTVAEIFFLMPFRLRCLVVYSLIVVKYREGLVRVFECPHTVSRTRANTRAADVGALANRTGTVPPTGPQERDGIFIRFGKRPRIGGRKK